MGIQGWSFGKRPLLRLVRVRGRWPLPSESLTLVHNEAGGSAQVLDFHRDFHRRADERNLTEHVLFLILYVLLGMFLP
jgi:hypothetical protein